MMKLDPVNEQTRLTLAQTLPDGPDTVISIHLLRTGLCKAYLYGNLADIRALVIRANDLPEEPTVFGNDVAAIWQILHDLPGWDSVNISLELADPLYHLMSVESNNAIRFYEDIYHTCTSPVITHLHKSVRLLTRGDIDLIESASSDLGITGFGSPERLLEEGYIAGTVICGEMVSVAQTYARSTLYTDIGVATLEPYRNRGFASACAALVMEQVQKDGQIPVWSAGHDNRPSRQVAHKLGFTEVLRRVYILPEKAS